MRLLFGARAKIRTNALSALAGQNRERLLHLHQAHYPLPQTNPHQTHYPLRRRSEMFELIYKCSARAFRPCKIRLVMMKEAGSIIRMKNPLLKIFGS